MKGFQILLLFALNVVYSIAPSRDPDMDLTTQEMAQQRGYACENYTVTTSDGYELLLFRIPGPRGLSLEEGKGRRRQPVLLQHGVLDSSDCFVVNGDPALAYMLADGGFDVWLPNFRGNKYSRRHRTLKPDRDASFWAFSIDELIRHDFAAIFDFVLAVTGYSKLSYIGHSMGGGTILAAASERPEYFAAHLRSVVGLAPSTCGLHSNNLLKLAEYMNVFDLLRLLGVYEVFNFKARFHAFLSLVCSLFPGLCNAGIRFLAGNDPRYDNSDKYDVFFNHYPDGTSANQMKHVLQQTLRLGYFHFKQDSFDPDISYNFTHVPASIPVAVFGGMEDKLVSVIDTRWLKTQLAAGGSLRLYKEYPGHGHLTFLLPRKHPQCYLDALHFTLEPN